MAVGCIALLFFLKTKSEHKNEVANQVGLAYGEMRVGDLVTQDSDGDTIVDWEENLWGTNPNMKDTDGDGTNDDVTIAKLKSENGIGISNTQNANESLTATDKLSRELFSTVAALTQAGPVDEETIEKISNSLSESINNQTKVKVFLISDIKISTDNSKEAFQAYINQISAIYKKYPQQGNVPEILEEFTSKEEPDADVLLKLDPIIKQTQSFIDEFLKMNTPSELSQLHLNVVNSLERLMENISDLQFFESDSVVAMGGMSKYQENSEALDTAIEKLAQVIREKLN